MCIINVNLFHSLDLPLLLLVCQPRHLAYVVEQAEIRRDTQKDPWCAFDNEKIAPCIQPGFAVEVRRAVSNEARHNAGEERGAYKTRYA